MKEADVEKYLHKQVTKYGGTTRKWVSPGRAGVPDRIVILPGGQIFFVELKRIDGRLTDRQRREHLSLRQLGCNVFTLHGTVDVDSFIREHVFCEMDFM